MTFDDLETEHLLERAFLNEGSAVGKLLAKHRDRLRRLVAERMECGLAARIDASDIVQEALLDARRKLPAYVRSRPLPYYPWLRRLALEKLVWWKRFHLRTSKRDVAREEPRALIPGGRSGIAVVNGLIDPGTSPSAHVGRDEERGRARAALDGLAPMDRRVLELRYFQDLSFLEIASEMGIGLSAVKMRHFRALERFHASLHGRRSESGR